MIRLKKFAFKDGRLHSRFDNIFNHNNRLDNCAIDSIGIFTYICAKY